jgi:hypothetical protein
MRAVKQRKPKSLLEEVAGKIRNRDPGCRTWFDALPQVAKNELLAVRDAYHAGSGVMQGAQKRAVAAAVMETAAERGWKTSGISGVIAWLNAKPKQP